MAVTDQGKHERPVPEAEPQRTHEDLKRSLRNSASGNALLKFQPPCDLTDVARLIPAGQGGIGDYAPG
jgi:hypothetical protein